MPSSWIVTRPTKDGGKRYRVEYRLGGRESATRYGGSFRRKEDATARKRWVDGELAALRAPDIHVLDQEPVRAPTLAEAAQRWQGSRVDVADSTRLQHRSAVRAAVLELGSRRVDSITPQDVAGLVTALAEKGRKRETIRKSLLALAMVLDHAGITPNPARDKMHGSAPARRQPGNRPADRGAGARRPQAPAQPLPAAVARARRDRDAPRRAAGAPLGRRRRATRPLARHERRLARRTPHGG